MIPKVDLYPLYTGTHIRPCICTCTWTHIHVHTCTHIRNIKEWSFCTAFKSSCHGHSLSPKVMAPPHHMAYNAGVVCLHSTFLPVITQREKSLYYFEGDALSISTLLRKGIVVLARETISLELHDLPKIRLQVQQLDPELALTLLLWAFLGSQGCSWSLIVIF